MTKQQQKSIASTPVMRAKASQKAFIAGGHVHDNRYIRYDESETYTNGEINLFLSNLGVANTPNSKLLRLDILQPTLQVGFKANGRINLGIIDDIGAADSSGNIRLSDFGNRVGGNAPTNNELTSHFVRYDVVSTLNNTDAARFASNSLVVSRATGLSPQTINSAINITGEFTVTNSVSRFNKGVVIRGQMGSDANDTIIRFANPELDGAVSVIRIIKPLSTTAVNGLDVNDLFIANVKTPVLSHHCANKQYVDSQITGLDLNGTYIRRDGENQMGGPLNLGNQRIINLALPTANNHGANKQYVDNSTKILSGVSSNNTLGFTPASNPIAPTETGKFLAILSGSKSVAGPSVLAVTVTHSGGSTVTRYINTRGSNQDQWSITIPLTVTTTANVTVSGDSGVIFNQFDLVKIGN